jgi:hypothetical protein
LPFNITAPGTYVLTGNLTSTVTRIQGGFNGSINISTAIAGPVVVDLKGFIITGPGSNSFCVSIGATPSGVSNTYPIIIQNGTMQNFEYGVLAVSDGTSSVSGLTVNKIVFDIISTGNAEGYGVNFDNVGFSTISNCTINGATYGIGDYGSPGGNSYNNNTFVGNVFPLLVEGGPFTLDRCQFARQLSQ